VLWIPIIAFKPVSLWLQKTTCSWLSNDICPKQDSFYVIHSPLLILQSCFKILEIIQNLKNNIADKNKFIQNFNFILRI